MTTIITRSALEFWGGRPVDPEIHHVVIDGIRPGRQIVTYAEHMAAKREQQRERLMRIRFVEPWLAWQVESMHYDQPFYGGWQVMLFRYDGRQEWPQRGRPVPELMTLFPVGRLALGDERDQWEEWKCEFARKFQRGTRDGRPRGVSVIWRRGHEMRR
jgi:hypothetical protein